MANVKYKTRGKVLGPTVAVTGHQLGDDIISEYVWNGGSQVTETATSVGHPWPPSKAAKRNNLNIGGAFRSVQYESSPAMGVANVKSLPQSGGYQYYIRGMIAPDGGLPIPSPVMPDNPILDVMGTTGFNRTLPNKPQADVAQFLAEAHKLPTGFELLQMKKNASEYRERFLNKAGSDYLNLEFGWKPFLNDIIKAVKSFVEFGEGAAQFERDSGKIVHRRTKLDTVETPRGSYSQLGYGWPVGPNALYKAPGTFTLQAFQTQEAWFVAAYRYYVQPSNIAYGIPRGYQLLSHMYGLRIDPALLWELAPWSWMLDYAGNIGDVLENFSAFSNDNLVALRAYLMVMTTVRYEYTLVGLQFADEANTIVDSSMSAKAITRVRVEGGPYGFGYNQGSLSPKRVAILAALGLSRL